MIEKLAQHLASPEGQEALRKAQETTRERQLESERRQREAEDRFRERLLVPLRWWTGR